jgi:hypothetical protein
MSFLGIYLFIYLYFEIRLRFFHIDGKVNAKVQSILFPDLPIASAKFTPDGGSVLVTGGKRFFYTYDIAAGGPTTCATLRSPTTASWSPLRAAVGTRSL